MEQQRNISFCNIHFPCTNIFIAAMDFQMAIFDDFDNDYIS